MKPRIFAIFFLLTLILSITALADNSVDVRYADTIDMNVDEYVQTTGVSDDDALLGLIITSVPSDFKGAVTIGSRQIRSGDALIASGLEDLTFTPLARSEMQAMIEYIPVYSSSGLGERESLSINIFDRPNTPPAAGDIDIETYKNVAITTNLLGEDADGDDIAFAITSEPKRGTVEVVGGRFIYTPNKNKVGKDKFTYTAVDSQGNVSEPATVNIIIKKTVKKLSYADMEGNKSHYAAMRLAEEDVFVGEQLGTEHYFMPDKTVTRGEFLTMTLKAVGLEADDLGTSTGFADEEETPAWLRPYITTGIRTGIISGVATRDDGLVFRPDANLTRAEAVVIVNNALGIGNTQSAANVMTDESVPAWAHQATLNLESYGMLEVDDTGSYQLSREVTRAEAAELICAAMDIVENRTVNQSLLSWAVDD